MGGCYRPKLQGEAIGGSYRRRLNVYIGYVRKGANLVHRGTICIPYLRLIWAGRQHARAKAVGDMNSPYGLHPLTGGALAQGRHQSHSNRRSPSPTGRV